MLATNRILACFGARMRFPFPIIIVGAGSMAGFQKIIGRCRKFNRKHLQSLSRHYLPDGSFAFVRRSNPTVRPSSLCTQCQSWCLGCFVECTRKVCLSHWSASNETHRIFSVSDWGLSGVQVDVSTMSQGTSVMQE